MITVNLLERTPWWRGISNASEETWTAACGFGALVMVAATVGGLWLQEHQERAALDAVVQSMELGQRQFREATAETDALRSRRRELVGRSGALSRLIDEAPATVDLLSVVSHSLPDGLWLVELKQKGTAVSIDGRATSMAAIVRFAERLHESGLFVAPVDVLSTTAESAERTDVVRFQIAIRR